MNTAHLSYPTGLREPRHYHETCGHYIYILKGRIQTPEGVLSPGVFVYVEESEAIFYTDGPVISSSMT